MRFKDFLTEKAMNRKEYAATEKRIGNAVKIGFEFEMIVPQGSNHHVQQNAEIESRKLSELNSFNAYNMVFDMNHLERVEIRNDFWDWTAEQEEAGASRYDFTDWIKARYGSPYKFVKAFDLRPSFGWLNNSEDDPSVYIESPQDEADTTGTTRALAKAFETVVGDEVIVHDMYHEEKKNNKNWYIEPDSSIRSVNHDDHGLELVSPPLPYATAMQTLVNVCKFMNDHGIETNESTGLHINVSVPDLEESLDPVKLVLFMGESYALKAFKRQLNTYTRPQIDMMMKQIQLRGFIPRSAEEMIGDARDSLSKDKYFTVNFGTLSRGYLEFRPAGGANYHKDVDKLKDTVGRFVTALEIACDIDSERQLYLKKLTNLFDKSGDDLQKVTKNNIDKLPKELHRLYRYGSDVYQAWEVLTADNARYNKLDKRHEVIYFIQLCMKVAKAFKKTLDLQERIFMKKLMKQYSVQSKDIDDYFSHEPDERLAFKREIGI